MEAQEQTSQPTVVVAPAPTYESCEQCGAPVDAAQRYCVQCGARRKHVSDPAARFMSSATSRARAATRARQQTAGSAGGPQRGVGLGLALAVALIPAGVGLGVVIGHSNSSNSNDAALIAALKAQKQEVVNVGVAGSSTGGSSGSGKAGGASKKSSAKGKQASSGSSTSSTAGTSAAGYKATSSTLKAGAAVVATEQKTVGKSYVGSQQGLPSVVSVP